MAEIDNLVINVEVTGDTKELGDIALLIEGIDKKTEKATSKMASFGASIKNMLKSAAFIRTMRYLGNAINKSMEYTESLNLFNVAMGEYADEAKRYAEEVSQIMGIDPAEWLKAQGTFNILATGFGVAADKAAIMSKNLTQLGYDLSSFYNISVQDAMLKLQSGLAGELEPLRRLGYDLSVARLQQEAYALGIDKSITAMTQAEKSMLRYHAIMSQVTEVQGDMARTLESPANQTRILKAQIDQLNRAIGNIFIPLLNKMLPYLIAMAQFAREAAESIALFFGFTLPEVDYSSASASVGDIATDLDDANSSAKELKRTLMGFDEINRLTDDKSGSGAGAGGGVGFDMDLLEYDFLGDALKKDLDDIKAKLEPIKKIAEDLLIVFAAWKLTNFINDLLKATGLIKGLPLTQTIGIALAVAGVAIEWKGIIDAVKNGLNASNLGEIVAGAILTVIGGALIGKMIPFVGSLLGAAAGAIIAGIPAFVTGVYDAVTKEITWQNAALIAGSATMIGAGIGTFFGPGGTIVGALIGFVVGTLTDIGILIYQKWDEICEFFRPAAEWLDANIFKPMVNFAKSSWEKVKEFFSPAVEWFSALWGSVKQTADDVFYNIGVFASGSWEVVKLMWQDVATWFDETILTPMSEEFAMAWEEVSKGASEAWEAIKLAFKPVTDFFGDIFSKAWAEVSAAFSTDGGIFTDFKDSVLTAFKSIVNPLIDGINKVISKPFNYINDALNTIRNVNIMGIQPFSGLRSITVPVIPKFAEGGFPNQGELFVAREAGAEMVGAIGRRTAVANNQQIVDGIYKGVYQAMRDAGGNNGGGQRVVVMLPNVDVLGEAVVDWHNGVVKQTGNTPLLV